MKQFLKRFRIPLIVVGVLCLLSATALITHRAYAVKSAQDEGKSTQSTLTDGVGVSNVGCAVPRSKTSRSHVP